ncbi:hypothetical protein DB346_11180 [Verrucomicrobia bacterium LW23]|nr:hypothetical protein DB346_11180 [Verrucomicrobia bacterium LW23]
MIPARKNAVLDAVCYFFLLRSLRKHFHSIRLRGRGNLNALAGDRPVLAFCNHTNWWDALLVFFLTRHLPRSVYAMMEEKQLVQYQFFTWFGAFSVDLTSPRASLPGVRYACQRLEDPANLVWIFPQGKIVSPHVPMQSQPGTAFLARKSPRALMLPVAFRYEFFRDDKPLILIDIGAPFEAAGATEQVIQQACADITTSLADAVVRQDLAGFDTLLAPRWSMNKRWDWFRHAIRGRLAEFDPEN